MVIPENRPAWIDRPSLSLPDCPLAIPSIGVAFHVLHHISDVTKGGPADRAGLQPGDDVEMIQFFPRSKEADNKEGSGKPAKEPKSDDIKFSPTERNWPAAFWFAQSDFESRIVIVLKSPKKDFPKGHEIELEPVADWFTPTRGFAMQPRFETRRAANIGEATSLGFRRARDSMIEMWMTLKGLILGRISHKALGGPIRIAETAFAFSRQGFPDLILFLGILSVSLAVMNFLPIPVLDGGHFVFLCWEGIRGKPPSEKVIMTATYVGLAFILSLMAFVFYTDISSYFVSK
jgi:regulator of sigma E protease